MTISRPHVNQTDRDAIEDLGLSTDALNVGAGTHAQHQEEVTAA